MFKFIIYNYVNNIVKINNYLLNKNIFILFEYLN